MYKQEAWIALDNPVQPVDGECNYGHRQLRIYLLDRGMFTVVLATGVWPTAPRTPTATA
jgi:hypothetical protein